MVVPTRNDYENFFIEVVDKALGKAKDKKDEKGGLNFGKPQSGHIFDSFLDLHEVKI